MEFEDLLPDVDKAKKKDIKQGFDHVKNTIEELRSSFKRKYGDYPRVISKTGYNEFSNNFGFKAKLLRDNKYSETLFSLFYYFDKNEFKGSVQKAGEFGFNYYEGQNVKKLISDMLKDENTQIKIKRAIISSVVYGYDQISETD